MTLRSMTPAKLVLAATMLTATRATVAQTARGDTVTVEQRVLVGGDMTPATARRRALDLALGEAMRRRLGVRVQAGELAVSDDRSGRARDSFLSIVEIDAGGRATDYRVLSEQFVTVPHPTLGAQLYYDVRALVTVARDAGVADPAFHVAVSLNDALFFDNGGALEGNGEVIATITATRDCYVSVFSLADDSLQVLLPNEYIRESRLSAGGSLEFPSADWRARGLHLRASLAAGRDGRREILAVVATRTPVAFTSARGTGTPAERADGPASFFALQRWLVGIPLDQRAVAFAAYEVRHR
jgi:hypothetical protein